ncbi:hypothetical protein Tsp_08617 [Trichinella spiralis]|uniref:hypothetical protein n=1 Tax=Trichinella spiralis TaxID=6334 RepID=UPI0001EFDB3F|nr:hypothetical protein Tsp_08617 [Trichinella spiralis]
MPTRLHDLFILLNLQLIRIDLVDLSFIDVCWKRKGRLSASGCSAQDCQLKSRKVRILAETQDACAHRIITTKVGFTGKENNSLLVNVSLIQRNNAILDEKFLYYKNELQVQMLLESETFPGVIVPRHTNAYVSNKWPPKLPCAYLNTQGSGPFENPLKRIDGG